MSKLEYEMHQLAMHLQRGTISPRKAAERLLELCGMAHNNYIPDPDNTLPEDQ